MADNIKVVIKVRPLIKRETEDDAKILWKVQNNSISALDGKEYAYVFDRVFPETSSTKEVYDEIAGNIVESSLNGINGTIFAYGQTSSGKTFTMMGDEKFPGIIPLAVHDMFDKIQAYCDRDFLLRVSYIEIYNEKIIDLLDPDNKEVKIFETPEGLRVSVKEQLTSSPEQVLSLMKKGEQNRHVGCTNMNDRSSRSHTIFQIIIESKEYSGNGENADDSVNVSQLNLVDLAGSERAGQTGTTGQRFKEGASINKSLSTLSMVIKQLSEAQGDPNRFISFRDSKLTRILQTSLGGNAKTNIICTVTPAVLDETHSTLQFASRAKSIQNKPEVNTIMNDATLLKKLTKKLTNLQEELDNKKDLETDNRILLSKIKELHNIILNSIRIGDNAVDEDSEIAQRRSDRRKTWCPSSRTGSKRLSSIPQVDSQQNFLNSFITPTLQRYKCEENDPRRSTYLSNILEVSDETEPVVGLEGSRYSGRKTPEDNKSLVKIVNDEVICLDNTDVSDSNCELKFKTKSVCDSPHHVCYIATGTPPCILKEMISKSKKEYDELVEMTTLEKLNPGEIGELMDKINFNQRLILKIENALSEQNVILKEYEMKFTEEDERLSKKKSEIFGLQHSFEEIQQRNDVITALEKKILQLEDTLKQNEVQNEHLEQRFTKLNKAKDDAVKNEKIMHIKCEKLQTMLAETEIRLEMAESKSAKRERELLDFLKEVKHPDVMSDVAKLDQNSEERNFFDMSCDLSFFHSDEDSSGHEIQSVENTDILKKPKVQNGSSKDSSLIKKLVSENQSTIYNHESTIKDLRMRISRREKEILQVNAHLQQKTDEILNLKNQVTLLTEDNNSFKNIVLDLRKSPSQKDDIIFNLRKEIQYLKPLLNSNNITDKSAEDTTKNNHFVGFNDKENYSLNVTVKKPEFTPESNFFLNIEETLSHENEFIKSLQSQLCVVQNELEMKARQIANLESEIHSLKKESQEFDDTKNNSHQHKENTEIANSTSSKLLDLLTMITLLIKNNISNLSDFEALHLNRNSTNDLAQNVLFRDILDSLRNFEYEGCFSFAKFHFIAIFENLFEHRQLEQIQLVQSLKPLSVNIGINTIDDPENNASFKEKLAQQQIIFVKKSKNFQNLLLTVNKSLHNIINAFIHTEETNYPGMCNNLIEIVKQIDTIIDNNAIMIPDELSVIQENVEICKLIEAQQGDTDIQRKHDQDNIMILNESLKLKSSLNSLQLAYEETIKHCKDYQNLVISICSQLNSIKDKIRISDPKQVGTKRLEDFIVSEQSEIVKYKYLSDMVTDILSFFEQNTVISDEALKVQEKEIITLKQQRVVSESEQVHTFNEMSTRICALEDILESKDKQCKSYENIILRVYETLSNIDDADLNLSFECNPTHADFLSHLENYLKVILSKFNKEKQNFVKVSTECINLKKIIEELTDCKNCIENDMQILKIKAFANSQEMSQILDNANEKIHTLEESVKLSEKQNKEFIHFVTSIHKKLTNMKENILHENIQFEILSVDEMHQKLYDLITNINREFQELTNKEDESNREKLQLQCHNDELKSSIQLLQSEILQLMQQKHTDNEKIHTLDDKVKEMFILNEELNKSKKEIEYYNNTVELVYKKLSSILNVSYQFETENLASLYDNLEVLMDKVHYEYNLQISNCKSVNIEVERLQNTNYHLEDTMKLEACSLNKKIALILDDAEQAKQKHEIALNTYIKQNMEYETLLISVYDNLSNFRKSIEIQNLNPESKQVDFIIQNLPHLVQVIVIEFNEHINHLDKINENLTDIQNENEILKRTCETYKNDNESLKNLITSIKSEKNDLIMDNNHLNEQVSIKNVLCNIYKKFATIMSNEILGKNPENIMVDEHNCHELEVLLKNIVTKLGHFVKDNQDLKYYINLQTEQFVKDKKDLNDFITIQSCEIITMKEKNTAINIDKLNILNELEIYKSQFGNLERDSNNYKTILEKCKYLVEITHSKVHDIICKSNCFLNEQVEVEAPHFYDSICNTLEDLLFNFELKLDKDKVDKGSIVTEFQDCTSEHSNDLFDHKRSRLTDEIKKLKIIINICSLEFKNLNTVFHSLKDMNDQLCLCPDYYKICHDLETSLQRADFVIKNETLSPISKEQIHYEGENTKFQLMDSDKSIELETLRHINTVMNSEKEEILQQLLSLELDSNYLKDDLNRSRNECNKLEILLKSVYYKLHSMEFQTNDEAEIEMFDGFGYIFLTPQDIFDNIIFKVNENQQFLHSIINKLSLLKNENNNLINVINLQEPEIQLIKQINHYVENIDIAKLDRKQSVINESVSFINIIETLQQKLKDIASESMPILVNCDIQKKSTFYYNLEQLLIYILSKCLQLEKIDTAEKDVNDSDKFDNLETLKQDSMPENYALDFLNIENFDMIGQQRLFSSTESRHVESETKVFHDLLEIPKQCEEYEAFISMLYQYLLNLKSGIIDTSNKIDLMDIVAKVSKLIDLIHSKHLINEPGKHSEKTLTSKNVEIQTDQEILSISDHAEETELHCESFKIELNNIYDKLFSMLVSFGIISENCENTAGISDIYHKTVEMCTKLNSTLIDKERQLTSRNIEISKLISEKDNVTVFFNLLTKDLKNFKQEMISNKNLAKTRSLMECSININIEDYVETQEENEAISNVLPLESDVFKESSGFNVLLSELKEIVLPMKSLFEECFNYLNLKNIDYCILLKENQSLRDISEIQQDEIKRLIISNSLLTSEKYKEMNLTRALKCKIHEQELHLRNAEAGREQLLQVVHSIYQKLNCSLPSMSKLDVTFPNDVNSSWFFIQEAILNLNNQMIQLKEENIILISEVQSLTPLIETLSTKILNHQTNLAIIQATSYAEDKLLRSQLASLSYHHGRLHEFCEQNVSYLKKQLKHLIPTIMAISDQSQLIETVDHYLSESSFTNSTLKNNMSIAEETNCLTLPNIYPECSVSATDQPVISNSAYCNYLSARKSLQNIPTYTKENVFSNTSYEKVMSFSAKTNSDEDNVLLKVLINQLESEKAELLKENESLSTKLIDTLQDCDDFETKFRQLQSLQDKEKKYATDIEIQVDCPGSNDDKQSVNEFDESMRSSHNVSHKKVNVCSQTDSFLSCDTDPYKVENYVCRHCKCSVATVNRDREDEDTGASILNSVIETVSVSNETESNTLDDLQKNVCIYTDKKIPNLADKETSTPLFMFLLCDKYTQTDNDLLLEECHENILMLTNTCKILKEEIANLESKNDDVHANKGNLMNADNNSTNSSINHGDCSKMDISYIDTNSDSNVKCTVESLLKEFFGNNYNIDCNLSLIDLLNLFALKLRERIIEIKSSHENDIHKINEEKTQILQQQNMALTQLKNEIVVLTKKNDYLKEEINKLKENCESEKLNYNSSLEAHKSITKIMEALKMDLEKSKLQNENYFQLLDIYTKNDSDMKSIMESLLNEFECKNCNVNYNLNLIDLLKLFSSELKERVSEIKSSHEIDIQKLTEKKDQILRKLQCCQSEYTEANMNVARLENHIEHLTKQNDCLKEEIIKWSRNYETEQINHSATIKELNQITEKMEKLGIDLEKSELQNENYSRLLDSLNKQNDENIFQLTKKFNVLQREYDDLKVNHMKSIDHLNMLSSVQGKIIKKDKEIESLKSDIKVLRDSCTTKDLQISSSETKNKMLQEKITAGIKERIEIVNLMESEKKKLMKEHSNYIQTISDEKKELQDKIKSLSTELEKFKLNMQSSKADIEWNRLTLENQSLTKSLEESKIKLLEMKKKLASSEERCKELDEECDLCFQRIKESDAENKSLMSIRKALELRIAELQAEVDSYFSNTRDLPNDAKRRRQSVHDANRPSIGSDHIILKKEDITNSGTKYLFEEQEKRISDLEDALDLTKKEKATFLGTIKNLETNGSKCSYKLHCAESQCKMLKENLKSTKLLFKQTHDELKSLKVDYQKLRIEHENCPILKQQMKADIESMHINKHGLEAKIAELKDASEHKVCSNCSNSSSSVTRQKRQSILDLRRKITNDVSTNTTFEWQGLSFSVDISTYEVEVEKNRRLQLLLEEQKEKIRTLSGTLKRLQQSVNSDQFDENTVKSFRSSGPRLDSNDKAQLKEMEITVKHREDTIKELRKEISRLKGNDFTGLKEINLNLSEKKTDKDEMSENGRSSAGSPNDSRSKRQTVFDKNRMDVDDSNSVQECKSSRFYKDVHAQLTKIYKELRILKGQAGSVQPSTLIESQITQVLDQISMKNTPSTTGSGIVGNQKLFECYLENRRLKKVNTKLIEELKKLKTNVL